MDIDRTVTDETIFNLYWAYYGRDRAMQFWRTVTDAARDSGLDQKRRAGNRSGSASGAEAPKKGDA